MKRTIATLTLLGALALACGESDDGSTTTTPPPTQDGKSAKAPPPTQPAAVADSNSGLDARWNGMGLPVGDATVIVSDPTVAFMVWDQADFLGKTQAWKDGFGKSGWTVADSFKDQDFEAAIYTKDQAEVGWAIGADQGAVMVYLEDLTQIPEEESTVKAVKSGETKLTRNTRPRTLQRGSGTTTSTPRNLDKAGSTTSGSGRALQRDGSSSGSSSSGSNSSGPRKLGN